MSLANLHLLTTTPVGTPPAPGSYEYLRDDEIKISENVNLRNGQPNQLGVQGDPLKASRIFIGYGYDITNLSKSVTRIVSELSPYLAAGVTISADQKAILNAFRQRRPLNGIVPTRNDVLLAWSNIQLASEPKASELLASIVVQYESTLNTKLGFTLDPSKERAALVSMMYNSPALIGSNLISALQNNDRAEAWFQIRYKSNGGSSISQGIANRRYRESELFGLYGDGAMDDKQSKDAFRAYLLHQADIVSYEQRFPPSSVGDIISELQPARTYLVSTYGRQQNINGDVLVGDDNDNSSSSGPYQLMGSADADLIFGEGGNDEIDGDAGNDVIYGGRGSDVLSGGEGADILVGDSGNDVLKGGAGDDRLEGGADYDTYIVKDGEGNDTIVDKDGSGIVEFADGFLVGGRRPVGGTDYFSVDGKYTYHLSGQTLTVTQTGGGASTLTIENFHKGDLNIELLEDNDPNPKPAPKPPLPPVAAILKIFTAFPNPSPIVLDLDGNGVSTTSLEEGAHFDLEDDGFRQRTGWVQPTDGLLALDRNGDGKITSGRELFGNQTLLADGSAAPNGFVALAELDVNQDGVIDSSDPIFSNLVLWKDADGDGQSTPDELLSLAQAGVQSISVAYIEDTTNGIPTDAFGNQLRQVGSYTTADGTVRTAIDVWFKGDPSDTIPLNLADLPEDIRAMPDAKGSGKVVDLRQAMFQDGVLKGLVQSFAASSDPANRLTLANQIVLRWTNSDTLDPHFIIGDAVREYHAIEQLTGMTIPSGGYLNATAIPPYEQIFQVIRDGVWAQLMAQAHLKDLYALVNLDVAPDGRMQASLASVQTELLARIVADPTGGRQLLDDFAKSLVGYRSGQLYDLASFYEFFRNTAEDLGSIVLSSARTVISGTAGDDTLAPPSFLGSLWLFPDTVRSFSPFLLSGGEGNDSITGADGPDALWGDEGSDTLSGGLGDDLLSGGAGNDTLSGGTGSDSYLFAPAFGQDVITEDAEEKGDVDRIVFQTGIDPTQVTLTRNPQVLAEDLIIHVGATDSITVKRFFANDQGVSAELSDEKAYAGGKRKIEEIVFADGTVWNLLDVLAQGQVINGSTGSDLLVGTSGNDGISSDSGNDTVYAGAGNDVVAGGDGDDQLWGELGNDTLDGGTGNDDLHGGAGNDVYLFGRGGGRDTISPLSFAVATDFDVVRFASDVSPDDVTVTRDTSLYLTIAGTADRLQIVNWFTLFDIAAVEFADGTTWDSATLWEKANTPTENSDVIDGGPGGDEIYAQGGNDSVQGNAGDDYLDGGDGSDSLSGNDGNDALFGDAGDDGLNGGSGDDYLDGGTGNDILNGEGGSNTFAFGVGYGNDTIAAAMSASTDLNTVSLFPEIGPEDVHVTGSVNSANPVIRLIGQPDTLTLGVILGSNGLPFPGAGKYQVEFSDGTIWDQATLLALASTPTDLNDYLFGYSGNDTFSALGGDDYVSSGGGNDVLAGGTGDDTLIGADGDDTIDGGAGNDSLYGAFSIDFGPFQFPGGSDTYVYGRGYGVDTIFDFTSSAASASETDRIVLNPDVAPGDLTVWRGGSDLYLAINGTTDRLKVYRYFTDPRFRIEQVVFSNGVIWDSSVLLAAPFGAVYGTPGADEVVGSEGPEQLYGLEGDDYLVGAGGGDTYDGGPGNDTLQGGEGVDTYLITAGGGNDTITDFDTTPGETDTVQFDTPAVNWLAHRSANAADSNLYIENEVTGQEVTIERFFFDASGAYHVERAVFQDGTIWDEATLAASPALTLYRGTSVSDSLTGSGANDVILGFGGDDTISGAEGNDVLNGGAGSDSLIGGAGDDTYAFAAGDGVDQIDEQSGADTISFASGIAFSDLAFEFRASASDVDLNISFVGNAGDEIVVRHWLTPGSAVEQLRFSDGTIVDLASLASTLPLRLDDNANTFALGSFSGPVYGMGGNDSLTGGSLNDQIYGGDGNDTISGGAGNDSLAGDAGDDFLDGGAGADTLQGGLGNDTYIVSDTTDIVVENVGEGIDSVTSSVGYALGANIENLTLGSGAQNGTGNELDNIIIGTANFNILDGGAGADTLIGGGGGDFLFGGTGNDTYIVDSSGDSIIENPDEGTDTVQSSVSYALGANLENLTLTGTSATIGSGNGLNNLITGNDANNQLDGGAGADTMVGGAGDDTYIVDNSSDTVVEAAGEGIDTVQSSVSYALGANIERLTITASGAVTATGNDLANVITVTTQFFVPTTIDGGAGADTLIGGFGNDTYVVDDVGDVVVENLNQGTDTVRSSISYVLADGLENIILTGTNAINATGNSAANQLTGNAAANVLDGGAGTDTMVGGAGDDTYFIDSIFDTVTELTGEGIDTVVSSVSSYTLGANLENLTLTGTARNATGNALDNVIKGTSGANTLTGGAGNDTYYVTLGDSVIENAGEGIDTIVADVSWGLGTANVENLTLIGSAAIDGSGDAGNNVITGNGATNNLDGGAGADTLIGGGGDDWYTVDNVGDVVIENANEGTDSVRSAVTYTLSANVENLYLQGTTAINGTGNASNNILDGNSAANVLTGGAGNDTLIGEAGADTLIGGTGDDTYDVDNTKDVVTENANEGVDTVQSSVTYTLGANIENLTLTGASAINGTGNALDNVLTGNSAGNTLSGGAGNDTYYVGTGDTVSESAGAGTDTVISSVTWTLGTNIENLTLIGSTAINGTGNTLNNVLIGNGANNTLSGGTGADTMVGGLGDDIYVVDNVGDVVTENAGEGIDTVQSSLTYSLGANVENLTLTGTTAINGTGNSLANALTGNSAANTLTGGAGNDTLNGGAGADTMLGGAGDDTYVVDATTDVVTENAGEGFDTVQSSVTYTLGNNVESLLLTGTTAINGTGNTLDNVLTGNSAANSLTGGAGNDTLNGAAGTDTLVGGLGDDTYVVDVATDVVTENANEGTDTVQSSVTLTLGNNVEALVLTGATAINGTGNGLNNLVRGNSAVNTLNGGTGNDVLEGLDGNDILTDTSGNNYLNGGLGADSLTGGAGAELFIGGAGNDTITTGTGADVIAFKRGDGADTILASSGQDNTISLGGGIQYQDLAFSKQTNDLVLEVGNGETITLKDWYVAPTNQSVLNLQVIADAMSSFDAGSSDPLLNTRVQEFNFGTLVSQFDQARAADPTLVHWSMLNSLLGAHLSASDTAALGGDLAYQYGTLNGTVAGIGLTPAQDVIGAVQFGSQAQTLRTTTDLQQGSVRLTG